MWAASTSNVRHQHVAISKKTMALFWIPLIFFSFQMLGCVCSSEVIAHVSWCCLWYRKFNVLVLVMHPLIGRFVSNKWGKLWEKCRARDSRDYIKEKNISTKKIIFKTKTQNLWNEWHFRRCCFFSQYILRFSVRFYSSSSEIYDLHGIIAIRFDSTRHSTGNFHFSSSFFFLSI